MRTKKNIFASVGLALLCAFGTSAHAVTQPYNPNNILRDDILINTGTMSAQDVQNFLNNQGSCLASVSPANLGSGNTQTAAQIIASAANTYGVNPQVILTTLQKEQSLITQNCSQLDNQMVLSGSAPFTYLNTAMGYDVPDVLGVGTCLYTFVAQLTGANCTTSGGTNHYAGAPASMRTNFDSNAVGPGGTSPFPQSFTVQQYSDQPGTITVSPVSKATSLLYRYTPYAYYGNYNFYTIFQKFFGNPTCATNLAVIHGDSSPESSVLYNGTRYPIDSLATLSAWGLDCQPVSTVSQATYNNYPAGQPVTQVFKNDSAPEVYIAQGGVRRHIRTSLYVHQLGLDNEPYSVLPAGLIAQLPEGAPMGFLVQASGSPAIYLSEAGNKYYVPDIPTIEAWGFSFSELVVVNPAYVSALPTAGNLSTLVKGSGPEIYVASLEQFVYAPSPARLQDWNMQGMPVTVLEDAFLQSLPKAGTLSRVTRGDGPDTYYIAGNKRWYVQSLGTLNQLINQYGATTYMAYTAISSIPYAGVMK